MDAIDGLFDFDPDTFARRPREKTQTSSALKLPSSVTVKPRSMATEIRQRRRSSAHSQGNPADQAARLHAAPDGNLVRHDLLKPPLVRARETAEIVGAELRLRSRLEFTDHLAPSGNVEAGGAT